MLNIMHSRRMEHNLLIREAIGACDDDSWQICSEDIVYVGKDERPYVVFRMGYGEYETKVRVARLNENTRNWNVGSWVSTDLCYTLEADDWVIARDDVVAATTCETLIPRGTNCVATGWDEDGDATFEIQF